MLSLLPAGSLVVDLTYLVPAGNYEAIYGNMPLLGLGEVAGVVPVNSRGRTAAERLRQVQ